MYGRRVFIVLVDIELKSKATSRVMEVTAVTDVTAVAEPQRSLQMLKVDEMDFKRAEQDYSNWAS